MRLLCPWVVQRNRGGRFHTDAKTLTGRRWREARRLRRPPYAADMDEVLHAERLRGRAKRRHQRDIDELPDGAFAVFDGSALAIRGDTLLHWTPEGLRDSRAAAASYRGRCAHPAGDTGIGCEIELLL
jgi:hypothetical protein